MPTFIDESGDTGFLPGSSPRFLLCGVTTSTDHAAGQLRSRISAARHLLGRGRKYEFKSATSRGHPRTRSTFFEAVLGCEFRFGVVAIEKARGQYEPTRSRSCHWLATTSLASLLRPIYLDRYTANPLEYKPESVRVDDNRDAAYLGTFSDSFLGLGSLAEPPVQLVARPEFHDSMREDMIQLADMICGAFADHLDGKHQWYRQVQARSVGELVFNQPHLR